MSFARSPVFAAVLVSIGLWVLGVLLSPSGGRGVYSVLVCSSSIPDREICERLEKEGFSGLISESGQRVLLDSFGGIEQVPLDEFDSRVLPFDPRNDGYAKKLRSLFVQDEKRFIYIPQSPVSAAARADKKIAAALGDMLYSYYDAGSFSTVSGRQVGLSLILFCAASLFFFIIGPVRRALQPHAAFLFPLLPVAAPLCLGGAAGFALASLLAALAVVLGEPCFKRLIKSRALYHERLVLTKVMTPLLVIAYGALVFFSGLPMIFTLVVFACFWGVFAYALHIVSKADDAVAAAAKIFGGLLAARQKPEHRRFSPILILRPRIPVYAFSWAMIPFAAAAFIVAASGISVSSAPAASPILPSSAVVTEADYNAHFLFQSGFSEKSLHALESPNGMHMYELSPDGLSVIPAAMPPAPNPLPASPPFPLGDLLKFLDNPGRGGSVLYEILFAVVPLLFILSPLLRRKKKA